MKEDGLNGDVRHVYIDDDDGEMEIDSREDKDFDEDCCSRCLVPVDLAVSHLMKKYSKVLWAAFKTLLVLLYLAYFGYCMYYRFGDEGSISLLVGTLIGVLYLVYALTPTCFKPSLLERLAVVWTENRRVVLVRRVLRWILAIAFLVGLVVYFSLELWQNNPENLQALLGVAIFTVICFVFSTSRARINWYTIFWCIGLQFCLALLILRTKEGFDAFDLIARRIDDIFKYGNTGAEFVFGNKYRDHLLVFSILPVMMFFNALVYILYHLGAFEVIIKTFGAFGAFFLDVSVLEPCFSVGNILVGMLEAPLLARPFLKRMTTAELHSTMSLAFATVSFGVIRTFVRFGVPSTHLLAAQVISTPAAIAISRLLYPETKKSVYAAAPKLKLDIKRYQNILVAVTKGAISGLKVAGFVLANQMIFVSLYKLATVALVWFGDRAGYDGLTFEFLLSYFFYPFTYLMGVPGRDCLAVGELIAGKLVGSPIQTYLTLGTLRGNRRSLLQYESNFNTTWSRVGGNIFLPAFNQTLVGGVLEERSEIISIYAVCGFCSIPSIAVLLGSLMAMAPARKRDYFRLVLSAWIAGYISSFMTASIAGLLFKNEPFTGPARPAFSFGQFGK